MGFDENGDGLINQDEFTAAMESRLADGISLNGDLAAMYMDFYGFNDGGGQRVLDINGVNAMLADTSLYVAPRGPDAAEGFGINLNITPIERVVRGASLDDDLLNHGELAALFQQPSKARPCRRTTSISASTACSAIPKGRPSRMPGIRSKCSAPTAG